jgi:Flp pilus assembly protein TadD/4-amino-4-deoxy-L-arabinose transferase-like glycosyltransferase
MSSDRPGDDRSVRSTPRWVLPTAIAIAVLLRLEYLRELLASPFAENLLLDAEWYEQVARRIVAGEGMAPGRPFFRPPLYPSLLAAIHGITADGLLAPRLFQFLLGVLQVPLVHRIARRTHGEPVASLAAFLAATYGMFVYFEGEILTTAVGTFLTTVGTWALLEGDARGSWARLGGGGLAFGLAAITHGSAVPLVGAAVLWALFASTPGRRRVATLAVALGAALPIGGVTLRNALVAGEFVPIATSGGINFWVGNNPDSDGKSALAPGVAEAEQVLRSDEVYRDGIDLAAETLAEREVGRELGPAEISRYWTARTLDWMRDHPRDALVLLGRKLLFVVNGYEISNNRDLRDQAARFTPILGVFLAQLSVLLPLALLGIVDGGLRGRSRRLLLGLLVMHAATLVAFFVCARYRQPAVVWLLPFAGAGIVRVVRDLREAGRAPRRLGITGALLLVFFLGTNGSVVTASGLADVTSDRDAPFHRFNLAVLYERRGDLDRAISEYRTAAETGIPDPRIWLNLGNCLARTGRVEEARDAYRQAMRLGPDFEVAVRGNLGVLASEQRDWHEAIRQFGRCLELAPDHPGALSGLGAAHLAAGNLDEAIVAFRRALEVGAGPEVAVRRSLAVAYLESGLPEEAERECLNALRRAPDDVGAVLVLARVKTAQGKEEEAAGLWEKARRLAPDSPVVERAIREARAPSP